MSLWNPTPNPVWAISPIPILPLLVIRWVSVAGLNFIAFQRNVFDVPLDLRALIAGTCVTLEFLGYIYPYYKGVLKPATLLYSSLVYLLLMLVIGAAGEWRWMGSVGVFVVVNALLAAVCAGVMRRGDVRSGEDEEIGERHEGVREKC